MDHTNDVVVTIRKLEALITTTLEHVKPGAGLDGREDLLTPRPHVRSIGDSAFALEHQLRSHNHASPVWQLLHNDLNKLSPCGSLGNQCASVNKRNVVGFRLGLVLHPVKDTPILRC